jgi:transposase
VSVLDRRCIGLDVHREFAQVAVWQAGRVRQAGQIKTTPEELRLFADSLASTDEVAIEATCNTHAIVRLLEGRVARVVVSNPSKTRAIAEAKIKTDKVDAATLAKLLAADFLPGVWVADDETQALRRQVSRRAHIVRQRTRLKNQVQSILHRNLIAKCPAADLFGIKGRKWLAEQSLPADELQALDALLRQLDFQGQELRIIDAALAKVALSSSDVKRLTTIPGVDATVALSIVAAVGDFSRFSSPNRLVSYLGLNPRVRQSGGQPASHGRITKQGRAHARGMLVEAALVATKTPGPLRAFFERCQEASKIVGRSASKNVGAQVVSVFGLAGASRISLRPRSRQEGPLIARTSASCRRRSRIAAARISSPRRLPQSVTRLLEVTIVEERV